MKKRNSVALGAAALFAFTGCVVDLAFADSQMMVNAQFVAQDFGGGRPIQQDMGGGPIVEEQEQQNHPGQHGGGWPVNNQCAPAHNPPGPNGQCPATPTPPPCRDSSPMPPAPKPGECYARCITPAVFGTKYQKLQVCAPCPIPSVTPGPAQTATKPIVVKEAAQGIVIPPSRVIHKKVQVNPAYSIWEQVSDAVYQTVSIPNQQCTAGKTCVPEFSPVEKVVPGPTVMKPVPVPAPPMQSRPVKVLVKEASTRWVRKPGDCSPEDRKLGLTDCDTMCLEITPAVYKTFIVKECPGKGPKACSFTETPVVLQQKVTVLVPGPLPGCDKPGPVGPIIVKVMVTPPQFRKVDIPAKYTTVKVCENDAPTTIDIPAVTENVTFNVPSYNKHCTPVPGVTECIPVKYQVCDPVMVWRPVLCEDKVTDTKIISVQKALAGAGFYQGALDGSLNPATMQALRDYQASKGLPQGGGMTIETLESLGIY